MDSGIGGMQTMVGGAEGPSGGYTLATGGMFGCYRVIRPLGRGGMGEVYEVMHVEAGTRHALKLLSEELAADPASVRRFRQEAQVMSTLDHPHIVRVDDFGEEQGQYWLRMELIEAVPGKQSMTLSDLAAAFGDKLPQADVAELLDQMLVGLSYAHGHGVVHRDLKPSNVMVCEADGGFLVKITDFGLARAVGEEWLLSRAQQSFAQSVSIGEDRTMQPELETTGKALLGTYDYMSPEQRRGDEVDMRSDLYAVGMMAYRLLTGRQLGLRRPSEIDSSLCREWDAFITKALDENPAERFASAVEMRRFLGPVRGLIRAWFAGRGQAAPTRFRVASECDGETDPSDRKGDGRFVVPMLIAILRHWPALVGLAGAAWSLTTVRAGAPSEAWVVRALAVLILAPFLLGAIELARRKGSVLWFLFLLLSVSLPVLGPWLMLDYLYSRFRDA